MKRSKSESSATSDNEQSSPKRTKHNCNNIQHSSYLLNCSDDVLLNIFKYLSPFDLMTLHVCSQRLHDLCFDRTLWKKLDLRERSVTLNMLWKYVKFMQPVTKILAIRGNPSDYPALDPVFLEIVRKQCVQLEKLIIEDYGIPRDRVQVTSFPQTLKLLSLMGCWMICGTPDPVNQYLGRIDTHLTNLNTLILTKCNWLNSHSIMPISKIPNLKEVRLNSCYGLCEEIAYTSIACRCGLKCLEVLDLRDTFVGDSVISSFSYLNGLKEMYLENPSEDARPNTQDHQLPLPQEQMRDVIYIRFPQRGAQYPNNQVTMQRFRENDPNLMLNVGSFTRGEISDRSMRTLGVHCTEGNRPDIETVDEVDVSFCVSTLRESTNPNLRKLVVRNYKEITNSTLIHFIPNAPKLEYLDVTGTSVTKQGVDSFKLYRPNVTLISSFD